MSKPAPNESATAEEAPDPLIAEAERRLRLLKELTEIGMELARALKPRAEADEAASGKDPAAAFAPLSRAIRLTLALEARTDEELRDLKAGVVRAREEARAPMSEEVRKARKTRIEGLVADVITAEAEDAREFDSLYAALEERLEEDEAYEDCAERPLRETIERLCKDLMLTPDWRRWDGDGWINDGPPTRPRFSPFHQPSHGPLLDDEGGLLEPTPARQGVHALE